MRVLFIGGTGLISTAVSELSVAKGYELYLLTRGRLDEFAPKGAHILHGDISDEEDIAKTLRSYDFDIVIDWIAFRPDQIERDIRLFSGKVGQFIFISSASAYQKPPQKFPITEETPLENPYWQYSRDKIACERLLMESYQGSGFPMTIVRPSLTYGDRMIPFAMNSWSRPWTMIERIRRGRPIIVQGDGTSLWCMTHNIDFARGLTGLMSNTQAIGQSYHITSDEILTWNQIALCISQAAGVDDPELVHIPSEFIISKVPEMEGSLLGDKSQSAVFDNAKVKAHVPEFAQAEQIPFREGMMRTIAWFTRHPEWQTIDAGHDSMLDMLLSEYPKR